MVSVIHIAADAEQKHVSLLAALLAALHLRKLSASVTYHKSGDVEVEVRS
jgi:hypothetical protein